MITLLYNFITRLAASVMIYLPAGSVSEQNMLPLIFFLVVFFGHLSLFCHLVLVFSCHCFVIWGCLHVVIFCHMCVNVFLVTC